MYRYTMPSIIAVVKTICSRVRSFHSLFYDVRNMRGDETLDKKQPEMDSAPSQPKKKRRKVQKSLCFHSKFISRITDWLGSDDVTNIGIHGMGGVGKTTLAMQSYNHLRNIDVSSTNVYSVGWVSVELNLTAYQLQEKIAVAFGLDLEGDKDENRRASMLYAFLSRTDKKCILFLDDLWNDFRREDVGIPKNCKLIVVSRLLDVCRMLHCQEIIKVEPLTPEESWELFHYNIGGYGVSDSEKVSSLKKFVYNESEGLPLAITVLANSMMGMVDNASTRREMSIGSTQMDDMLNQLKLSYDRLNNIKLQCCFLYCALQPKGYVISKEELIGHWIRKKLIDDAASFRVQFDMGHSILNKLLNSCLLESCQDSKSIKVHDLVRRMALFIARDCSKVKADMPSKLDLSTSTNTIDSSSTSLSTPISQSLATQFPCIDCKPLYACTCQEEYPLCSDF